MIVLVLAGCGNSNGESTETSAEGSAIVSVVANGPEIALESFLDALRAQDYPATAEYVDEPQLALFASIESSDPQALIAMADNGIDDTVRSNFWSSFTEAIPGLAGATPGAVTLRQPVAFSIGTTEFSRITADFSDTGSSGEWVLRQTAASRWVVDVIATFGAAFVNPLNSWMESMPPNDRTEVVQIVATHTPSWEALAHVQGDDEAGVAVSAALAQLNQLLDSSP